MPVYGHTARPYTCDKYARSLELDQSVESPWGGMYRGYSTIHTILLVSTHILSFFWPYTGYARVYIRMRAIYACTSDECALSCTLQHILCRPECIAKPQHFHCHPVNLARRTFTCRCYFWPDFGDLYFVNIFRKSTYEIGLDQYFIYFENFRQKIRRGMLGGSAIGVVNFRLFKRMWAAGLWCW